VVEIKMRGCKIGIGHSWIGRGLKFRRRFPLNGREIDKVTWTRTSDGMRSDHNEINHPRSIKGAASEILR
jgi:hypothetical protein